MLRLLGFEQHILQLIHYALCRFRLKTKNSLNCTLILAESYLIVEYGDGSAEEEYDIRYQNKQNELSSDEAMKRVEEKHLKPLFD